MRSNARDRGCTLPALCIVLQWWRELPSSSKLGFLGGSRCSRFLSLCVYVCARALCITYISPEQVDLFTLLPAPSSEGLQVRSLCRSATLCVSLQLSAALCALCLQVLNQRTQKWVRVRPPPGAIIVNTGDYSQRLFNDRFPSTTHRVAPPPAAQQKHARTSFPIAVYLPEDFVLACLPECGEPRYRPMTSLDFHTATNRKYYGSDYRDTGADANSTTVDPVDSVSTPVAGTDRPAAPRVARCHKL